MMRKLVVGCGYLGERVARDWKSSGAEVIALTRSTGNAQRFRELGLVPIVGDVLDRQTLTVLPAVDTVLYAVGFDRSSGRTRRETHVDGVRNVLAELSGRVSRVIYISSTSVYGQNSGETIDESSECRPTTDNGRECLEAEQAVWQHFPASNRERRANILRLAGIYGPGRLLRRIEQVQTGEPLHGNPEAFLNLIHVDDAVQAVLACEAHGTPGATYLVADNQPIRRREYYCLRRF
jgi:nucleoside-diphosphate-sugar epimerase